MTSTCNRIDWDSVRESLTRFQSPTGDIGSQNRDQQNEVFRERAERLARRGRQEATRTARVPVVVFRVGNERYGIELSHVKQVFPRVPITPLPGVGGLLLGVANLNGSLRSVVDLGVLLNLSATRSDAGYVVLLRASHKFLGIWVETLEGVRQIDLAALEAVDEVASDASRRLMKGMTDDRIVVLEAKSLIERVAEQRRHQR
jgi:purine-binding chemotaxis protein CheW